MKRIFSILLIAASMLAACKNNKAKVKEDKPQPDSAAIITDQKKKERDDNDNEYTKVIGFAGGKAIEHCMKADNECSLTYFSGGRFLVALEGNKINADELKKIARGLKIK